MSPSHSYCPATYVSGYFRHPDMKLADKQLSSGEPLSSQLEWTSWRYLTFTTVASPLFLFQNSKIQNSKFIISKKII
jgi:hypothetical protein